MYYPIIRQCIQALKNLETWLDKAEQHAAAILTMLKDEHLAAFFPAPGSARDAASAALRQAKDDYKTLVGGDLFGRGRRLRNDAIAHLLIPDKPTPTVEYEAIYQLHDAAERSVVALCKITDRGQPDFPSKTPMLAGNAKVFWDTYFAGMRASQR